MLSDADAENGDAEEHGYVGMEPVVGENLILLQYLLPVDAEEHGYVGMEPVVGEYLILRQYLLPVYTEEHGMGMLGWRPWLVSI